MGNVRFKTKKIQNNRIMKIFKTKQYKDNYGVYYLINKSKTYIKTDDYSVPLYVHLKYKYENILWEMLKDEFYIIQNKEYDVIKSIIYNGSVVGFTASNFYEDYLIMELCYILPEYRNKGLFCKEVFLIKEWIYSVVGLNLPNRFTVMSLVSNGLAVQVNNYIVKSSIPLFFYHPLKEGTRLFSFFYDLRICGSVCLDTYFISPLLDVDIVCFNADKARDGLLNVDYFKKVSDCV